MDPAAWVERYADVGWPGALSQVAAMIGALIGSAALWKVLVRVVKGANAVEAAVYEPALDELRRIRSELTKQQAAALERMDLLRGELHEEKRRCDRLEFEVARLRAMLTPQEGDQQ